MSDIKLLSTVPVFSELSLPALADLIAKMDKRSYPKNSTILMEDENGDDLFVICIGTVKISRIKEDGREVVLAVLGKGEFFGEISVLDGESSSVNFFALENAEVLILKRSDFLRLLQKHPPVALSLLAEMARRIKGNYQQIESLALGDAQYRIGTTLLRLAEELGTIRNGVVRIGRLPYNLDIANMAGTSRETVSRIFTLFDKKGMLHREGNTLSIWDYGQFRRTFG